MFEKEADLAGLTVKEAYSKRARKPRAQTQAIASQCDRQHPRLVKFFRTASREADALVDEAAFADKTAAAELLSAAEAALLSVQRLRDLLNQQAGGQR